MTNGPGTTHRGDSGSLFDARFKVLGPERQSHHGGTGTWQKNRWRSVEGKLVPCENGIHYCKPEQLVHWLGPAIWLFEDGTPDETIDAGDKLVTRRGRVVERLETWNDRTARLFAADCAEAVIHLIPESHRGPFVAAVGAARGYARGEIGEKERLIAGNNAYAAAHAAAPAAAVHAAHAAAYAAAPYTAAATATAAAYDATAATSAAYDATHAAARRSQTVLLFEYLSGKRS